ncbi:MAG: SCO family protein [Nitrosomonadales bacterium]|jgi:protein SCO1/2|nr:SCO family protein [Nitrosomonadales bacterium]|tara:strand:+ start:5654 stop:6229 length:576 start_codon:yes stop_codon:yes gene_type:complete
MIKNIFFIIFSLILASCAKNAEFKFNGSDISNANLNSSFELLSHTGEIKKITDFKGSVVAIFFGFTHCPDICPTSMQELKFIKESLGKQSDKLQVIFITLDPERDNQSLLNSYVPSFDKSFIGLTGSQEDINRVASQYKIFHMKVGEGDSYTIDHSSGIYIIDKDGKIRVRHPYGSKVESIIEDIQHLISI